MATFTTSSFTPKTLTLTPPHRLHKPSFPPLLNSISHSWSRPQWNACNGQAKPRLSVIRASGGSDYSARRSSGGGGGDGGEARETIMLPGCDYNHWLIVMEFPKDPAPTREQMIDTYLNTLATVLGSMEEAKKNMYAFSTTTYTGFQCTVDEATSEKFKGLPGVLWVLPDSYIDVKNKDYGGDKYINGEIIPCTYPTYQPKQRNNTKYESRRYERRRDGPPPDRRRPRQGASSSESTST